MKVAVEVNKIKSIKTTSKTCTIKGYKKPFKASLYYTTINLKNGGEITYPFIQEGSAKDFTNLINNTLKVFMSSSGGEGKVLSLIAGKDGVSFLEDERKICASSYLAQKEIEMEKFL